MSEEEIKTIEVLCTRNLDEIRALRDDMHYLRDIQIEHIREIATLKVKAGLWSAVIGVVVAMAGYIIK